jgi:hypothetical protein
VRQICSAQQNIVSLSANGISREESSKADQSWRFVLNVNIIEHIV